MKKCGRCKSLKPKSEFYIQRSAKDGLQNKCKECSKATFKDYYTRNKSKYAEHSLNYYFNNKSYCHKKSVEYQNNRRNKDELYRFATNLRSIVRFAINGNGYKKNTKTFDIVGMDAESLLTWLGDKPENESIDHMIPSSYALNQEEAIALNHFSNLKWVEMKDNASKGNRYVSYDDANRVIKYHYSPELIKSILERECEMDNKKQKWIKR